MSKNQTREQRRLRRAENLLFLMIILAFVLVFGMTAKACADITGTPPSVQLYAALHTSDIATRMMRLRVSSSFAGLTISLADFITPPCFSPRSAV